MPPQGPGAGTASPNALARYWQLRHVAYRDAEQKVPPLFAKIRPALYGVPFQLGPIDRHALTEWYRVWRPISLTGWNWEDECRSHRSCWRRFEVAIWSVGQLCGLAIGRPSKGRHIVAMYLLEGNPDPNHPLKDGIAAIAMQAGLSYAAVLGAAELRLMAPEPGALRTYLGLGFQLANATKGPSYCYMMV
jgi:hypothetical protein